MATVRKPAPNKAKSAGSDRSGARGSGSEEASQLGKVETKDIRKESEALVPRALKIKVDSIQSDELAKRDGTQLKALDKIIVERFAKPKRDLDSLKRFVLDLEKSLRSPIANAISHLSGQCISWKREQDRVAEEKRLEEQKQAEAKARAAAEADAKAAEAAKQPELAQEIRDEPIVVPMPEAKPEVAKVRGAVAAGTWKAEVIGYPDDTRKFLELVVHVAQNPEFIFLLSPNMARLNDMARAQKQGFSIPGVRAVRSEGIRFSG